MEGTATELRANLNQLIHEAARVAVALDRVNGTIEGVPHYSVIEARAHELGRQLSRTVQARHLGELAASMARLAPCPTCGTRCEVVLGQRPMTSIDGPLDMEEAACHCPRCRRGFFPPPGRVGP